MSKMKYQKRNWKYWILTISICIVVIAGTFAYWSEQLKMEGEVSFVRTVEQVSTE